jgi:hypothetical protein
MSELSKYGLLKMTKAPPGFRDLVIDTKQKPQKGVEKKEILKEKVNQVVDKLSKNLNNLKLEKS